MPGRIVDHSPLEVELRTVRNVCLTLALSADRELQKYPLRLTVLELGLIRLD